jgi:predicted amidohydrolase YtcJ
LTPWGYEAVYNALKTGAASLFTKHGVTSVNELVYSMDGLKAWQQLHKEGEMPFRVRFFLTHPNLVNLDDFLKLNFRKGFGDDWLMLGGIKFFADGFGINAYFSPYNDTKYDQDELDELVYKVHSNDLQVWTHAVTVPGFHMALEAYRKAQKRLFIPDARMRLEHSGDTVAFLRGAPGAAALTEEEYCQVFKDNNIMMMATPQFCYSSMMQETPYATFIRKYGFKMFYNSDVTGSEPQANNPWFGIWEYVTRHHVDGSVHKPEEKLTVSEALRLATIWAAYSSFEENKKGSLESGKLADFLVLDRDPVSIDPEDLLNVECDLVVIDGKEKYAQNNCSGTLI